MQHFKIDSSWEQDFQAHLNIFQYHNMYYAA